jgi:hypothetical protein
MTKSAAAFFAALMLSSSIGPATAGEFDGKLADLARHDIARWIADPAIVQAVRDQNRVTSPYSEDQILALDKEWRDEIGAAAHPEIDKVLDSAASNVLRGKRDASDGLFTEIFVMDARGLNVAASDVTSDYWQGDEAKWQQTYPVGPNAVHIGDVEFDESTQTYQSQISLSIPDPATGDAIGAITVGVDVTRLD